MEKEENKKQRKGESNADKSREAARQFRERQRARVDELEQQIAQLESERCEVQGQVDSLSSENQTLHNHRMMLRAALAKSILNVLPTQVNVNNVPMGSNQTEKVFG
eukprot:TRINITY_DN902_c0_g1_i1.p1 TRINITY_DN902_c0_g1~~TRINITY_DN902_c0_g1_i1.p1  ORF type:complete len:106 (+),score=19.55 TRINITY_DN902_c0_g1_i1:92-409(+)